MIINDTTVGIYLIESPSGKVYIGQSRRMRKRMLEYKHAVNKGINVHLRNSIKKHGFDAHSIKILHYLPTDISQNVLNEYERFYCTHFTDIGYTLMNVREAGSNGRHSEETKKIIGIKSKQKFIDNPLLSAHLVKSRKGKVVVHSEEFKRKLSERNIGNTYGLGRKHTPETIAKIKKGREWYKMSEETKRKISESNKGKVISIEQRQKHSKSMIGRKYSEAHKAAISKGNMGKEMSHETRIKISVANQGRKMSQESISKRAAKVIGSRRTQETKEKMSKAMKGIKKSPDHVRKIADSKCRAVKQFDLNGIFIRDWRSASDVSRETGINRKGVNNCCLGLYKYRTAGGFKWSFA